MTPKRKRTPTAAFEQSDTKMDEEYNDPDADVALVSSDNLTFLVKSHYLLSSSRALRETLSEVKPASSDRNGTSRRTITFPDHILKRSGMIRLYLNLLHDRPTPQPWTHRNVNLLANLLASLEKYDCTSIMKRGAASLLLDGHPEMHRANLFCFILACHYDHPTIAKALLARLIGHRWTDIPSDGSLIGSVEDRSLLDVASFPPVYLRHVSPKYICALQRTCEAGWRCEESKKSWANGRADEEPFRTCLRKSLEEWDIVLRMEKGRG